MTDLLSTQESRLVRLSTYGVVPGCLVTLRQRDFAYVVEVDETEVALDHDVAREIVVRRR